MKKWDLKKIAVVLFAVSCISGLLTVGSVFMAIKANPNFAKDLVESIGQKATEGKDYQEIADEDIHSIKNVIISATHGDIDFQVYDGPTLKIDYSGKVPKNVSSSLIQIKKEADGALHIELKAPASNSNFSFNWDENLKGINFSDVSLRAKVYMPKSFSEKLSVQNINGDLHFVDVHAGQIVIASTNGDIELHTVQCQDLTIAMTNGELDSEGSRIKNWNVENVQGDLNIDIPDDMVYQFNLSTTNGMIENTTKLKDPANAKDVGVMNAKTVSGDIHINKYVEDREDRE